MCDRILQLHKEGVTLQKLPKSAYDGLMLIYHQCHRLICFSQVEQPHGILHLEKADVYHLIFSKGVCRGRLEFFLIAFTAHITKIIKGPLHLL